jgi:hypothetical protein
MIGIPRREEVLEGKSIDSDDSGEFEEWKEALVEMSIRSNHIVT